MDVLTAEDTRTTVQLKQLQKYGKSGGKENRGILTDIKAAELPDESLTEFSNAPFEFEETAVIVKEDLQRLYYHAGTANRFSDKYLKILPQMEKYIRQAGSLCLTKTVLEQKEFEFPKLNDLTILELVQMVSFHIRKCHAAIEGLYRDNNKLGAVYFQWELRWISLGERLKATGLKIRKIKDGSLKAEDLMNREEPFRNKPRTNQSSSALPENLFINPYALPMNHSMAADMLRKEQILEKQEQEYERLMHRSMKELGEGPIEPYPIPVKRRSSEQKPDPKPEAVVDTTPEVRITEAEARKVLIEDAMRRGDQKALMEIPLEDEESFYARWLRYVEAHSPKQEPRRSGTSPSADIRKKLRKKRKKNK